jgi:hypothetical protein
MNLLEEYYTKSSWFNDGPFENLSEEYKAALSKTVGFASFQASYHLKQLIKQLVTPILNAMKKIIPILLFLLPLASFAQCDIIGSKADAAKQFVKTYTGLELNEDESTDKAMKFGSEDGTNVVVFLDKGLVKSIAISALESESFSIWKKLYEQLQPCTGFNNIYVIKGTEGGFAFNGNYLSVKATSAKRKEIFIEKKQW